jgi:hypothetical protein
MSIGRSHQRLLLPKKLSNSAITPTFRAALWRNFMIAPSLARQVARNPKLQLSDCNSTSEGWTLACCPVQVNTYSAHSAHILTVRILTVRSYKCAHPQTSQPSLCKTLQHLCNKFVLRFDSTRKRTYCSSSRSPEGRKQSETALTTSRHLGRQHMRNPRAA